MTAMPTPALQPSRWPTTRILFALAGTVTLLSLLLTLTVSPWFLLLTAFCPASLIIDKLRPQRGTGPHASC